MLFLQKLVRPRTVGILRHQGQHLGPGLGRHRLADDMQPLGDQRAFGFQQLFPKRGKVAGVHVHALGLFAHKRLKIFSLGRVGRQRPQTAQAFLDLGKPLVKARLRQRRGQVADDHRIRAALGKRRFRRVVGGVKIDVRQVADQPIRPAAFAHARLFAGHEFQRPVHAEMQKRVGGEILAQPAVEGRKGMGRCEALLKEQPHRVAFIAEDRLQADEDIAKLTAQNEDVPPVGLVLAGGGAPGGLDVLEPFRARHELGRGNAGRDLRGLAMRRVRTAQNRVAQLLHAFGQLAHLVARSLHRVHHVEKAFENREICGGPGGTGIRREAVKHDADLAFGDLRAAQLRHADDLVHQRLDPLGAGGHRVAFGFRVGFAAARAGQAACRIMAARENGRVRRAVDFRQGDQHGGFHRAKPATRSPPLPKRLEFQRLCGDIGHIERLQRLDRGITVVIGRAADQREARERQQRVDLALQEFINRRATIQTTGESGQNGHALRLQRADHRIVMRGVLGQNVAAQHQDADGCDRIGGLRQLGGIGGDPARHVGVVKTDLGVVDRRRRLDAAPVAVVGIAAHQIADHGFDVVFGPAQPILHAQEPGPQILRLARDEFQHLRDRAQHRHLLFGRSGAGFVLAAQLFQKRHRPRSGLGHVQIAHLRQTDHLRIGDHADKGIQRVAHRLHLGHDHLQMFVDEQKVRDNDIGVQHRRFRSGELGGVFRPFGSGVNGNMDVGEVVLQPRQGAGSRTGGMLVQRDDHDVIAARTVRRQRHGSAHRLIVHNGPWPHRGFRR